MNIYTIQLIDGVQEYCPGETFQPSCQDNEVIVMEKAQYGRMSLGRCVKKDMGYCASNVLAWMDTQCSGKSKCEVKIPDFDLYEQISPSCKNEMTPYLEASYRCTAGIEISKAVTVP